MASGKAEPRRDLDLTGFASLKMNVTPASFKLECPLFLEFFFSTWKSDISKNEYVYTYAYARAQVWLTRKTRKHWQLARVTQWTRRSYGIGFKRSLWIKLDNVFCVIQMQHAARTIFLLWIVLIKSIIIQLHRHNILKKFIQPNAYPTCSAHYLFWKYRCTYT